MDSTEILQIQKSLIIGNSILGFVSLLGCLTIIFLFITRPYLRDLIFKLTFFLATSEIINIIAYFMSLDFLNMEQVKIFDSKYFRDSANFYYICQYEFFVMDSHDLLLHS